MALAKVIDMNGQDISPAPLTLQQEFMGDLIHLIQTVSVDEVEKILFNKYKIEKNAET